MTRAQVVSADYRAAGIEACDRCLALSHLTMLLARVPELRGEERRERPVPRDDDGHEIPPAPVREPLAQSAEGLAPVPGELARAELELGPDRVLSLIEYTKDWVADGVRDDCLAGGLGALCRCAPDYPPGLRALADPPPVLFVRGNAPLLERCDADGVAMVGTRRPTLVGREAARRIGAGAARSGAIVVSGMALGIDAASHEGALSVGGHTIAVLAGGADRPSPNSHHRLYHQILERGAVVSEMPPGVRPFVWGFPARNRIIAALARDVVVVEAPARSGALITVSHANDLGRQLYAVPGSLANENAEGTNLMLAEGALALIDAAGLKRNIGLELDGPVSPRDARLAPVHEALARGPLSSDEVARRVTSLGPGEVELALLDLELAGWIARRPDGRYRVLDRWGR